MRQVETAVAILNWNGERLLARFLPSVVASLNGLDAQLVVIDNGSTDESLALLEERWPEIMIVVLGKNYGFAEGYNRGLRALEEELSARYYVLLNSDVRTPAGWLAPLIARLKSDAKTAAVMPKILSENEPDHFEYAGACGGFVDRWGYPFCRGRLLWAVEKDVGQYDNAMPVHWATGACLAVKRELYSAVGGFDASFFAHMEEIDLCWRLRRLGHEVWVEPQATIYHLGGGTLGYESPRKTFLNHRNSLWMLRKNLSFWPRWGVLLIRLPLDGAAALMHLLKRHPQNAAAVLKAIFKGLSGRVKYERGKRKAPLARHAILWQFIVKKKKKFSQIYPKGI